MAAPDTPQRTNSCTLPYPDRFHMAAEFAAGLAEGSTLTEESKLLLYALYQQATVGPCNEPKPWGWSVVNNAKWQSWKQLGDMAPVEAMRLYVRTLEEEVPDWWTQRLEAPIAEAAEEPTANGTHKPAAAEPASADTPPAESAARPPPPPPRSPAARSVAEVVVEGSWVSPYIASERRPPPRYEHAVALVGSQVYIIGGSYGGRYLSDTWALNLEDLSWSAVAGLPRAGGALPASTGGAPAGEGAAPPPPPPGLPAIAGHAAVTWGGNVFVIGGHVRAREAPEDLPLYMLDTKAGTWAALAAANPDDGPRPRGGHSATLVGDTVFVFGGEDAQRRPLGDLWALNLRTLEWSQPEATGTPPPARSAHVAGLWRRSLLVFGGGSVATCFSDLWALDLDTLEWRQPPHDGPVPPPRAGHAAAVLGGTWYIVGGGNNASGCADMYALGLPREPEGLFEWVLVGNTPADSAIASEGLSLLPIPMAGCMLSFGGYNGKYHNAVHVYRPEGYVVVRAPPPAAAAHEGAPAYGTHPETAAAGDAGLHGGEYEKKVSELEAARRDAAAAKEAVAHELAIMRRQLAGAQASLAEAEKRLAETSEALASEQSKSLRLEVEVAELRAALGRMEELERELTAYRQRDSDAEAARRPGLWGFISGADRSQQ